MANDKPAQKDTSQYFEQYRMYLAGAEKISDRRESANKYFITLNSAIIALAGLVLHSGANHKSMLMVGTAALGLIICVISWLLINSYKQLNSAKFKIIHQIETNLPLQLYEEEWIMLGEGKDRKKYFPFSHVERLIPVIFGLSYLFILLILLLAHVK